MIIYLSNQIAVLIFEKHKFPRFSVYWEPDNRISLKDIQSQLVRKWLAYNGEPIYTILHNCEIKYK